MYVFQHTIMPEYFLKFDPASDTTAEWPNDPAAATAFKTQQAANDALQERAIKAGHPIYEARLVKLVPVKPAYTVEVLG